MATTWKITTSLRIIRDDSVLGAFSADFRMPDRLQQAWQCQDTGAVEWRDVEVVKASDIKPEGAA